MGPTKDRVKSKKKFKIGAFKPSRERSTEAHPIVKVEHSQNEA